MAKCKREKRMKKKTIHGFAWQIERERNKRTNK